MKRNISARKRGFVLFFSLLILSIVLSNNIEAASTPPSQSPNPSFQPAIPDEYTVRVPEDYPTIQRAIDAAKNGWTILVNDGNYHEAIDFKGKTITVKNADGAAPVIDGYNLNAHLVTFKSAEGVHSALEGFTFKNVSVDKFAIYCNGSSPTLRNNQIIDNRNDNTVGIYCTNFSNPYIANNVIKDNNADNFKAIVCENDSSPQIIQNNISNNSFYSGSYFRGVYCSNNSSPQIINNLLNNRGTGIYCLDSSPVILSNSIHAVDSEGVYCQGNNSSPQIIRNIISNAFGAGIHCLRSAPKEIRNNIIVQNNDGIILEDGPATLKDTLIINNIIFSNLSCGIFVEPADVLPMVDYNDIFGNPLNYYPPFLGPGPHDISANPLFVYYEPPNTNNDYRLQSNSPCVDAGDPNPIYNDPEDPENPGMALAPAWGTVRNDIGAYGGPTTTVLVVITSPKEGEFLSAASPILIEWAAYGMEEMENLKLTIYHFESSQTIIDINEITSNTGQYLLPPNTLVAGRQYTLELSKQLDGNVRNTVHFSTLSLAQRSNGGSLNKRLSGQLDNFQQTNR